MSDTDGEVLHDMLMPIVIEAVETALDIAIHGIEASKARVREEADNLKEAYLAGRWRDHGLTKRQCEDRLARRTGQILGHEAALSVLYTMKKKES